MSASKLADFDRCDSCEAPVFRGEDGAYRCAICGRVDIGVPQENDLRDLEPGGQA